MTFIERDLCEFYIHGSCYNYLMARITICKFNIFYVPDHSERLHEYNIRSQHIQPYLYIVSCNFTYVLGVTLHSFLIP